MRVKSFFRSLNNMIGQLFLMLVSKAGFLTSLYFTLFTMKTEGKCTLLEFWLVVYTQALEISSLQITVAEVKVPSVP